MSEHVQMGEAGAICVIHDELWPCRDLLLADNAALREREQALRAALTFDALRAANMERCVTAFGGHDDWEPERWALATFGEAGEACNALKKLIRGDGSVEDVGHEIADMVIYADLWAARMGLSLGEIIARKFNIVSDRVGSEIRLPDRAIIAAQQPGDDHEQD